MNHNQAPPVSIYIITYLNTEERCQALLRCCRSALAQDYPDFEVVVSDNVGEYHALDVLSVLSDDRLKVVRNEKNVGFAGNINRCLDRCIHDIIKPMCDDDMLHPEYLAVAAPRADSETLVVVDFEKFGVGNAEAVLNKPISHPVEMQMRPAGYGHDLWNLPFGSFPSGTLFSRELFRDLGGYSRTSLVADWDFLIRACMSKTICFIKQPLCYMEVWDESLTEQINSDRPFYFPSAGLSTRFGLMANPVLTRGNRVHLRSEMFCGFLRESVRFLAHLNSRIYRSGFVKYLNEWKVCMRGSERTANNYTDPAYSCE